MSLLPSPAAVHLREGEKGDQYWWRKNMENVGTQGKKGSVSEIGNTGAGRKDMHGKQINKKVS